MNNSNNLSAKMQVEWNQVYTQWQKLQLVFCDEKSKEFEANMWRPMADDASQSIRNLSNLEKAVQQAEEFLSLPIPKMN